MSSRTLIAFVCVALLIATTASLESAAASSGPSAVAAKKCKKIKNKAKRKKCKKQQQGGTRDPIANATSFLAGHSYSYLSYSNTSQSSTSYRIDLCSNGTFHFRGDYVGYSGYAWADSYDGTWKVSSATASSAQVAYTTSNYQVSDSYYASPPPSSGTLNFQALSETVVTIDGTQFSRGAGSC